jgi:transcriptional regulator with XRE-family HTH domain
MATYASLLARNLRAARAAAELSQGDICDRMRELGFGSWQRSTMSLVERGKRRLSVEEIFALAYVVNSGVERLMSPIADDGWVAFPSGKHIRAEHAITRMRGTSDGAIRWDGNTPVFADTPSFAGVATATGTAAQPDVKDG